MEYLSPLGPVYQAGTLSGNPLAMAAGLATLELIDNDDFHAQLARKTAQLVSGFSEIANKHGVALQTRNIGAMFGLFFNEQTEINQLDDVMRGNQGQFTRVFHAMLKQGIYLAPSMYEAGFMSSAHSDDDIAETLTAFDHALTQ